MATPTVRPRGRTEWGELSWSAPAATPDRGSFHATALWKQGYVAVGEAILGEAHIGAAFMSRDGVHWARTTGPDTFAGIPAVLVAMADELVTFVAPFGAAIQNAYVSSDGNHWVRSEQLDIHGFSVDRLAARGSMLIALTSDVSGKATLLRYSGGQWTRTQLPSKSAILRGITSTAEAFLALGREGQPDRSSDGIGTAGSGRPAAWSSSDGTSWTAVAVDGSVAPGAELRDAFAVRDGYLALGSDTVESGANPRSPKLWRSTDGQDWRLIGAPAHWGLAGTNGQQLIVLTRPSAPGANPGLEAWASQDGQVWVPLVMDGAASEAPSFEQGTTGSSRVDAMLVAPGGIVVLGQDRGVLMSWFCVGVGP